MILLCNNNTPRMLGIFLREGNSEENKSTWSKPNRKRLKLYVYQKEKRKKAFTRRLPFLLFLKNKKKKSGELK